MKCGTVKEEATMDLDMATMHITLRINLPFKRTAMGKNIVIFCLNVLKQPFSTHKTFK